MKYNEYFMYKEIFDSPGAFENVLSNYELIRNAADFIMEKNIRSIIFVGCGTSYYAAMVASYAFNILTSIKTYAYPSSEIYYYDFKSFSKPLLAAFSRSGETTETVLAVEKARKKNWYTLSFTNSPESRLAKSSDTVILTNAGEEKSVIMTKTFSSMIFQAILLALELGKRSGNSDAQETLLQARKIPNIAKTLLNTYNRPLLDVAKKFIDKKFTVLGKGPNFGTALEGALKLRETSYISSNAFSTLEFRHGPLATVDENLVVIGMLSSIKTFEDELKLYREISEKNGNIVALAIKDTDYPEGWTIVRYTPINEILTPVINIIPIQLLSFYISVSRGCNPDRPRHLTKVVKLDNKMGEGR